LCRDGQAPLAADVLASRLTVVDFIGAYKVEYGGNARLERLDSKVVYVVTTKAVKEGEEVMLSFGPIYWLRQFTLQRSNLNAQRQALDVWNRLG
jgi:hypothetical protein